MTAAPVSHAEQYLLAVRRGESPAEYRSVLGALSPDELNAALDTDEKRLAFWINCYNAITQRVIVENETGYKSRRDFFATPHETVAGYELSLNDIQHDILRCGYHPYGLGYLWRPTRSREMFAQQQEPNTRDPRIHFALNCGAETSPPVAVYTSEDIHEQLDVATQRYLDQHVEYEPDETSILTRMFGPGKVTVPRVMLWYRGDFGRKRDIISFLRYYDQLPQGVWPRIAYDDWSWAFDPADYATHTYLDCSERTEAVAGETNTTQKTNAESDAVTPESAE